MSVGFSLSVICRSSLWVDYFYLRLPVFFHYLLILLSTVTICPCTVELEVSTVFLFLYRLKLHMGQIKLPEWFMLYKGVLRGD